MLLPSPLPSSSSHIICSFLPKHDRMNGYVNTIRLFAWRTLLIVVRTLISLKTHLCYRHAFFFFFLIHTYPMCRMWACFSLPIVVGYVSQSRSGMTFGSCRRFNSGDSGEGINARAPRGAGGTLKKEVDAAPTTSPRCCCCTLSGTRSWRYPGDEDWTGPKKQDIPNVVYFLAEKGSSLFFS